ncbi:hypothetical protein N8J89_23730 [Crossiella sp. CA-258035]|uniref:hypothetical protein n=1 Tax=Crossiella sp. CA-258035 TaxID=2981138 RepID=UPI0024BC6E3E|nr:hypothetical protein [Crossiella sp. CA-258035]WHT16142.1 hypothetical protein N8J89_23730 [Crossiella sp. CA-258035]
MREQRRVTSLPGTDQDNQPPAVAIDKVVDLARAHLVAGCDRRRMAPATTLEDVLDVFTKYHVEVELR